MVHPPRHPRGGAPEYVNAEVAWWLRNKGPDTLLLVHAGGAIAWDRAANDFTADSTAIPPVLHRAFPQEPRWIDMTWFNQPGSLRDSDPRFIERVADLSAAVRGVPRDTLIGENVAELRKARRLARGGSRRIGAAARRGTGRRCGGSRPALGGDSSRDRGAIPPIGGHRGHPVPDRHANRCCSQPPDTDDSGAGDRAITAATLTASPHLEAFVAFADRVTADGTDDGRFAVGTASGEIHRDRQTGAREMIGTVSGPPIWVGISADGKTVAAAKNPYGNKASPGTASLLWREDRRSPLCPAYGCGHCPRRATSRSPPRQTPTHSR